MEAIPRMAPTSNHIFVKHQWFKQNFRKAFLIKLIKLEYYKAYFNQKFALLIDCQYFEIDIQLVTLSYDRECSKTYNLHSYMDTLWSKSGYFGL